MNQSTIKQNVTDRLFIQEIINDLEKNGYVRHGKAHQLLKDWSRELRDKTNMRGRTKSVFRDKVGIEFY